MFVLSYWPQIAQKADIIFKVYVNEMKNQRISSWLFDFNWNNVLKVVIEKITSITWVSSDGLAILFTSITRTNVSLESKIKADIWESQSCTQTNNHFPLSVQIISPVEYLH